MDCDDDIVKRLYYSAKRIRRFEEVVADIYPSDKIKSPIHLAIGQEAPASVICDLLKPTDVVAGTYRSHALYLAKGGSCHDLMAEMYGKASGCCKGKGGSMHVIDPSNNLMGTSAVVGTGIPNAAGAALAMRYTNPGGIVACFFGDGATEEGVFYETLNFASLKKLPILFVCENNGLAIHTSAEQRRKDGMKHILSITSSLGVPSFSASIPSMGIPELYEEIQYTIWQVRSWSQPWFINWPVYRYREHVGPNEDFLAGYRTAQDKTDYVAKCGDFVETLEKCIDAVDPNERVRLDVQIETEIAEAVEYAENAPLPHPDELLEDVYAE